MTSTLRGRQPSLNDVPDDREVNSVIRVAEAIAHSADVLPRLSWHQRLCLVTEAMSRFADALEASFNRVAPQSVLGQ
jgi:hypothetical protein